MMRYKEILFFIWVSWLVKVKTLKDKLSFREIEFISSKINIVSSPKTNFGHLYGRSHSLNGTDLLYILYWHISVRDLKSKFQLEKQMKKQHQTRRVTPVQQVYFETASYEESYFRQADIWNSIRPGELLFNRYCETVKDKKSYSPSTGIFWSSNRPGEKQEL